MKKFISAVLLALCLAVPVAAADYKIDSKGGATDPVTFRVFGNTSWNNIWQVPSTADKLVFLKGVEGADATFTGSIKLGNPLVAQGGLSASALTTTPIQIGTVSLANFGSGIRIQHLPGDPTWDGGYGLNVLAQYPTTMTDTAPALVWGVNATAENLLTAATGGTVGGLTASGVNRGGTLASVYGLYGNVEARTAGTTVTSAVGVMSTGMTRDSAVITTAWGFFANPWTKLTSGTITNMVGYGASEVTAGTNNTNVLLGTATVPAGNWSIYSASTRPSYYAGQLQLGDGAQLESTKSLLWSSGALGAASDVGISRMYPGELIITDGSSGYGSLYGSALYSLEGFISSTSDGAYPAEVRAESTINDPLAASIFKAKTGDGVLSARYAYTSYEASELVQQDWHVGLNGSLDFSIKNVAQDTIPFSINSTSGNVTLTGTLQTPSYVQAAQVSAGLPITGDAYSIASENYIDVQSGVNTTAIGVLSQLWRTGGSLSSFYAFKAGSTYTTTAVEDTFGLHVPEFTFGTQTNVGVLIGDPVPTGDWALYSGTTRPSFLAGPIKFGSNGLVGLSTDNFGTLEVTNGSTGAGDMSVGNLTITGTCTGCGGGFTSPTTTKGDLIVDNGTTEVRLPVGTDGKLLTADSSASSGVTWAEVPGSNILRQDFQVVLEPNSATLLEVGTGAAGTSGGASTSVFADGRWWMKKASTTVAANVIQVNTANMMTVFDAEPDVSILYRTGSEAEDLGERQHIGIFTGAPGTVDVYNGHHAEFRYSTPVDGTAYWRCITGTSNTNTTVTTTTVPVTVDTTYVFRIAVDVGVSVKFYINNVLVATHTTNLPSGQDGEVYITSTNLDGSVGTIDYLFGRIWGTTN